LGQAAKNKAPKRGSASVAAFFIIIGFDLYSTFLAKIKALWRRKTAIQALQICNFRRIG
jgi:hypothetical protein